METTEVAALLRPFIEADQKLLHNTLIYINLLMRWNARVNLTAVRAPAEIVQRHFGESFFAAEFLLDAEDAKTVIDLGSGAGFPGVPIAMLRPKAQVTLIEAQGKKAAFLNEVIRALNLENAKVFNERAEGFPGTAGLVTIRAVEKFSQAASLALKLVSPGGRLALMIGSGQVGEARELDRRLNWQSPVAIPGGHSRVLLVGTKPVIVE